MKKIKVKDVPSICPRCGGWLASTWCRDYVSVECIGGGVKNTSYCLHAVTANTTGTMKES